MTPDTTAHDLSVLLVGSGGREHALAWKLAQSPHLKQLYTAPGNSGTAQHGENVPIGADDVERLVTFAREKAIDLVVVGPEGPLAAGLVDALSDAGLRAFGPRKNAARIEASKAFAKDFMQRHGIPTSRYAVFTDYEQALIHLHSVDYPVVVKASGLAAGKGVIVPESLEEAQSALRAMLVHGEFGPTGRTVVIEERLQGEEVSLMAFCDGATLRLMPAAQDHKRLLEGDGGPNTGGMGAYAPAPVATPQVIEEALRLVLQPAAAGLRAEGHPFVGVLYAGLMLTSAGMRVLEFNCRFGDPETQVVLPLLESDLLEVMEACVGGRLEKTEVRWRQGAAVCVVLASEDYPGKSPLGRPISGLESVRPGTMIFHAGTQRQADQVLTGGGRVLGVAGWGETLQAAHGRAYGRIQTISFNGMQFRKDIGKRAMETAQAQGGAYSQAGVDIQAGNRAVALMSQSVRSTYGPEVLAGIGAFGGLYDAGALQQLQHPVLVASTDGVGTKVKLAAQAGSYQSIGQDLVNHCINDILVQGARPLFFLDYFAAARLEPEAVAEVVEGLAAACRAAGCALLGGETAEMPGVYAPGEFDVAGTIVGVVERQQVLPRPGIAAGDLLLGIGSSGPHTNGYSLIRRIFEQVPLDTVFPELGLPLGQALLAPHRSYLNLLHPLLNVPEYGIKALAHLTGGGFIENIPRILPEGLGALVRRASWQAPPLFKLIQRRGQVNPDEMYHVFNMGIGMVLVVSPAEAPALQQALAEETWVIGHIIPGERKVILA